MSRKKYADRIRSHYAASGVSERAYAASLARVTGIDNRTAHAILQGRPIRSDAAARVVEKSPIPVTIQELTGWPS